MIPMNDVDRMIQDRIDAEVIPLQDEMLELKNRLTLMQESIQQRLNEEVLTSRTYDRELLIRIEAALEEITNS
jgi:hypothetical protein